MNRNLGIERVYTLGEYQTLRVTDHIENLPEDLALDSNVVDRIRALQLISLDIVYETYVANLKDLKQYAHGSERASVLIEQRANLMEELKDLLNKKGE